MKSVLETGRLSEMMFGGGVTSTAALTDDTQRFLHVLEYGLDWNAPSGRRSAYDFAQAVDFSALLKDCPDLPQRVLEFVVHWVLEVAEEQPTMIALLGGDDTLADVRWIWARLAAAVKDSEADWGVDPGLKAEALEQLTQIKQTATDNWEDEEGSLPEALEVIDGVVVDLIAATDGQPNPT